MHDRPRGKFDHSYWNKERAQQYNVAKHGPDGRLLLDGHIYRFMIEENLRGQDFLDLGAGTGPWSQHALNQGA